MMKARIPIEADKTRRVDENAALRKTVGRRFKLARELNGWTQEEAAERLQYSNSTQLSLAEKGERMPPMAVILRASKTFGVSIDFLMGVSDEPERDPKAAERNAVMRRVTDIMEMTSQTIVTAVLAHSSDTPSVAAARRLIELAARTIESVENMRRNNLKKFDNDLRGASTVLMNIDELQAAVGSFKQVLDRHEQVLEAALRSTEQRLGIVRPLFEQHVAQG